MGSPMKNKKLENKIIDWLMCNDKYVVAGKRHTQRSEALKLASHILEKESTIIASMVHKRIDDEK